MTYTNLLELRGPARPRPAAVGAPGEHLRPRWEVVIVASLVAALCAGRRGLLARTCAAFAGVVAARALAGHDDIGRWRASRPARAPRDVVELASEDSMIASDPPSWVAGGAA